MDVLHLAAGAMTLSKFIQIKEENSNSITSWVLPKIEDDSDMNATIKIDDDFIGIDFTEEYSPMHTRENSDSGVNLSENYLSSRDKGYDEGYEIGRHEAESIYAEKLKENSDALKNILRNLAQPYATVQQNMQKEIAELAILIAEKMVLDHIKNNPDTLLNIVAEGIQLLPSNNMTISLSFNPVDLQYMQEHLDVLEGYKYKLQEDASLQRGSVKITSDKTDVDLSLDKRIHDLVDQFFKDKS